MEEKNNAENNSQAAMQNDLPENNTPVSDLPKNDMPENEMPVDSPQDSMDTDVSTELDTEQTVQAGTGMPVSLKKEQEPTGPQAPAPEQPSAMPTGYMQGPMQPTGPQYQPKKKRTGLIVGISVAAAAVVVVAAAVIFSAFLSGKAGGPRGRLARGIANMAEELVASFPEIPVNVQANKLMGETPFRYEADLTFTLPEYDVQSVNFGMDVITDRKAKKAACNVTAGAYGFDMSVADIVAADNTLYLKSPYILGESVYSLELTDLGKNFNQSSWAKLTGTELPEGFGFTLFDESDDDSGPELSVENPAESILDIFNTFNEDMEGALTYSNAPETKEIEIGNVTVSCKGVTSVLDKDAFNGLMEDLKSDILESEAYTEFSGRYMESGAYTDEDLGEVKEAADMLIEAATGLRLEEDLVLDYYFDKKGRIVNISTPKDLSVSHTMDRELFDSAVTIDKISVDLNFTGTQRALDKIDGGFYFQQSDGQVLFIGIKRDAEVSEGYYKEDLSLLFQEDSHIDDITIRFQEELSYADKTSSTLSALISVESGGSDLTFTMDGVYSDIVKGKSGTYNINNAILSMDGQDELIMSGKLRMEFADQEISVPADAVNLLEMSEEEIYQLMESLIYS